MAKLESAVNSATSQLQQRAAQLTDLKASLEQQTQEVAARQAALDEREAQLAAARKAAEELEAKNASLVKSRSMELGKMHDLKQALNATRQQVRAPVHSTPRARSRFARGTVVERHRAPFSVERLRCRSQPPLF